MATLKYLTLINGIRNLVSALTSSAGAGDANKIIATNASGLLDSTFLPPTIGQHTITAEAGVALTAGNLVNLYDDTGTLKARKASATVPLVAHGFVLQSYSSAASATIYLNGNNTAQTGLTLGARYFLGTNGGISITPVTASTNLHQAVGVATSASDLVFRFEEPILIE